MGAAVFEKEDSGGLEEQVWGIKGVWVGAIIRELKVLDSRKGTS